MTVTQAVAGQSVTIGDNITTADDCTASELVAGIANITNLQTSAAPLNSSIPVIGIPNNSALFLPTDAAWAAFWAANGAIHHPRKIAGPPEQRRPRGGGCACPARACLLGHML